MVVGDVSVGTEVLVIGGGPGGYVAAIRAAQLGKDVTLIEQNELGGTCLQVGCIPSKAIIGAADVLDDIKNASKMGISATNVSVDAKKLQAWKQSVVRRLTLGVNDLCKKNGITILRGKASFESSHVVRIESEHGANSVKFTHCIIATGSVPISLPSFPIDHKTILDSSDALALEEIPESLIVLGGGYIGVEIGTALQKFGTKVTIVEATEGLLPGQDRDLVAVVQKKLEKSGATLFLSTLAKSVTITASGVELIVDQQGKSQTLTAKKLLVAVGRKPFSSELRLENVELHTDAKGFISVNEHCQTSVSHIYAIGDVIGQPMLAHKATRDGIVAAEHCCGKNSFCSQLVIPAVIFTDPEIATVGLSEQDAIKAGKKVSVGTFPLTASGRALTMNATEGFVRIVSGVDSKMVLGVQMVGPHVSELIAEATLAIEMGATVEDLSLTIHPHPTLSESLKEAAEVALGHALHLPPSR